MTAVIIPFPTHVDTDLGPWGVCPTCAEHDGFLNDYRDHWFVCDRHLLKWCVGSNLFSTWQFETALDWERNRWKLAKYREVEPGGLAADPTDDPLDEARDAVDLVATARRIFTDDLA
jgi:hypothetical protein